MRKISVELVADIYESSEWD